MKNPPPNSIPLLLNLITLPLCKERLQNVLRDHVGSGKRWSVQDAADQLNIDAGTLYAYLNGQNAPNFDTLVKMFGLFGPEFTNRILRLAELDGARRIEAERVSDFALNGGAAALMGQIGKALADGRIDHTERPAVLRAAQTLARELNDWIAENDTPAGQAAMTFVPANTKGGRA